MITRRIRASFPDQSPTVWFMRGRRQVGLMGLTQWIVPSWLEEPEKCIG